MGDQDELAPHDLGLVRPETDPAWQTAETLRTVADVAQSQSRALRFARNAARSPG